MPPPFLGVPLEEASAKIRTGPPQDAAEDYALACWVGVLSLQRTRGVPQSEPSLPACGAQDPGRS